MAAWRVSRRVASALAVVVVAGVGLPMAADPVPPAAAAASAGGALSETVSGAARRATFLGAQTDDDAAEAAADAMGAEATGEDTGAGDPLDALPPAPEGANPLPPDPEESVLPDPVEQVGEVERITTEAQGPASDSEPVELDAADEVVARRTEWSKTFANGDGSFTTETSMEPLHVEHRGGWEEIDVELHDGGDGEIVNGMAPVEITLAEDGSSDELAVVGLEDGQSVGYGLVGADDVEPDVEGAVATYEDILPGVDIELESGPSGLKETAVLASAEAPSELVFTLDLEGLTAEVEDTGGVALSDEDGEVVAAIPPGFMVDSAPDGGVQSDAVDYSLEERSGESVLVVTPDRGWLEDPARVWPVRVDPTTVDRTSFEDTYVKNGTVANRSGALELRAGPEGGANTAAYMKFYLDIPAGSFISAATLHAHNSYSAGGCTPKPVGVYRVTQSWDDATMTGWPGATYSSAPVDTQSFAKGGGPSCPADWASWNVRSLVDGWVKGVYPNSGLSLRVPTQYVGDAGTGKRFTSIEGSNDDPIIRVSWSPWGATYNPGSSWTDGQEATNNTTGYWPLQMRNVGSETWVAGSNAKLGTRVYLPSQNGTGTPVAQTRTPLPEDVSPQELIGMDAKVPPLPPGTYHVFFEMVKEGEFWFSAEDLWNPRQGIAVQIVNQVPRFVSNAPDSGDTVDSRQPTLSVVGEDPDDFGYVIDYFFRICPVEPENFPATQAGCQSSGWQSADSWTPPTPLDHWNQPAYWWAFIRDRSGPEPRFAEPVMIIPTPDQPTGADLGSATATASDGGVDVRTGNFTSRVTDLAIGWGSSSFAITRTYNSMAWSVGSTMGRGWSSVLDVRLDGPTTSSRPASLTMYRDDGRKETWARDVVVSGAGEEVYKGPLGSAETLTWDIDASRYVWRKADRTEYWFNTSGRLTSIARPGFQDIQVTRATPTSAEAQTFVVDGTTVTVEWSAGKVAAIRTAGSGSDARWRYDYQAANLVSVCDPRPTGERGCQTYTYEDYPSSMTNGPVGPLETASMDGSVFLTLHSQVAVHPKVLWRRDGEGNQWDYQYSFFDCPGEADCNRTRVTQPNPAGVLYSGSAAPEPLVFEFDRFDRLVKRFDERGQATEWVYDALGYLSRQIDENGIARFFWHDSDGYLFLTTDVRKAGTGPIFSHTLYVYDKTYKRSDPRWSQPIRIYDPRVSHVSDGVQRDSDEATWMWYDADGRLTQRRSPATDDAPQGRTELFAYVPDGQSGAGQLRTSTDHVGRVTTNTYDSNGRLSATVTPSGVRTELAYTAGGRVESSTTISDAHPGGVTTSTEYDELGQAVRVVSPPVTNVVDNVSRQVVVERTFDPSRRLVEETLVGTGVEADRTTQWTDFDGNGRPTEVVDAEGRVTTSTWTWRGHVLQATIENGLQVLNRYARTGQLARVYETDLIESPGDNDLVSAFSYDQAGRLAVSVDARGAATAYTYWDDGRARTTTLTNYMATPSAPPEERLLSEVSYDLAGNPATEVTRDGMLTTVSTYDLSNALTRVESAGRYVEYDHRADGLVEAMTVGDATHADLTQYGYTELPDVRPAYTAQHRGGYEFPYIVGYFHDDRGLLTGVEEPGGRLTDMDYDAIGQLVRTTGPAVTVEGHGVAATSTRPVTETGYDSFGEVIQEQAADGTTQTSAYDRVGRLTEHSLPGYSPSPGASLDATTSFGYDDAGRTRTITDELRGTTVTERLDHRGRRIEVEDPPLSGVGAGGVTSVVRNTAGDVVSTMGPDGQVGEATFDNTGRVTRSRQIERFGTPGTFESTFVYGPAFDLVQAAVAASSAVFYEYNAFGELRSERTTPAGSGVNIASQYERDHRGRVVRTEDNLGRAQESSYDQVGLVSQTRSYSGSTLLRTEDYSYDSGLNLETVSRPGPNPGSGRVTTSYEHDPLGRLTSMTEPGGLTTSYGYDIMGRKVRSTDGNGNATWSTYTPWGDVESVVDPATTAHPAISDRTWHSTYEAPGLPDSTAAPGGVALTVDYDGLGNVTSVSGTGGDGNASKEMEWDASGRLVEMASPAGATQLTWDDRGNVIETTGLGGASSMRYDGAGRMTSRSDGGATSTFSYWMNGLLKTATGDQTGALEQYSYDETGALRTLTYPSGTTRTFSYDGLGNMATDTLKTGSSTLATQSWTYGPDGAHVASTTTGPTPLIGSGVESYTYDGAGRLTTTTRPGSTTTSTWDASGNRLTHGPTAATYDERNRVLTSGPPGAVETYSWTARGTLDSVTGPVGTTDFQFDAFDRLTREVGPGVDDQYQWDAIDRMATIDGAAMSYAALERDPVAVPGWVYERGPGGEPRAFEPNGGTAQFLRSNQRGDVGATFVPGATTVAASQIYTPFGEPTPGATPNTSFGYQGDWTSGSGLVHMDARFYDPGTGAFISRDSWDLGPGPSAYTNRYTYGAANPVSNTDPTGHKSIKPPRPNIDPGFNIGGGRCASGSGGFTYLICKSPRNSISSRASLSNAKRLWNRPLDKGTTQPPGDDSSATGPGGGGSHRQSPTTPKPPPRPVPPWWTNIRPSTPAPPGHLVPPASASQPIVEESLSLLRDPTDVPLAGYMPETSSQSAFVPLDAGDGGGGGGGGSWGDEPEGVGSGDGGGGAGTWGVREPRCQTVEDEDGNVWLDNDGDPVEICQGNAGVVLPPGMAAECLIEDWFGDTPDEDLLESCTNPFHNPPDRWYDRDELEALEPACSFSADTRVLMADGTTKPISEIVVGDWVVAIDPETGARGAQQVTHVWVHQDQLLDLRVGDETLTTTEDHPFWNETDQAWQSADELDLGDQLLGSDGTTATVGGLIAGTIHTSAAYNLSVDAINTYLVVVDDIEILVHNVDPECRINGYLAGGQHPISGVPFDEDGFPDFSAWRHPDFPDLVPIVPSATRPTDRRRANAEAGLAATPRGYVWHHHQDSGMMELIEREVHERTNHTGGFNVWGGGSPNFRPGGR